MSEALLIENGCLYSPAGMQPDAWLLIRDGKITAKGFGQDKPESIDCVIDAKGKRIISGLIDLHIHGVGGFDVSGKDLVQAQSVLPAHGITAFFPTSYVLPRQALERAIREMAEVIREKAKGAQVLGIHMEGPWLAPKKHGAADPGLCYALTKADIEQYQRLADGNIRMITFAPEEGQAMEVIPWLVAQGIIPSIGHTDADYEMSMRAIALGAKHATHTYNAMRGLHHREPGTVGAVMDAESVLAELIADGHHVHPSLMRLLIARKTRQQVCLVSDAVLAAGMPDGNYTWGNLSLIVQDGTCRLADGTLAGSIMLINKMIQVLVEQVGVAIQDAIYMASTTPAKHLGLNKGLLEAGRDADVVILDDDYMPCTTIINGEIVYQR